MCVSVCPWCAGSWVFGRVFLDLDTHTDELVMSAVRKCFN